MAFLRLSLDARPDSLPRAHQAQVMERNVNAGIITVLPVASLEGLLGHRCNGVA